MIFKIESFKIVTVGGFILLGILQTVKVIWPLCYRHKINKGSKETKTSVQNMNQTQTPWGTTQCAIRPIGSFVTKLAWYPCVVEVSHYIPLEIWVLVVVSVLKSSGQSLHKQSLHHNATELSVSIFFWSTSLVLKQKLIKLNIGMCSLGSNE